MSSSIRVRAFAKINLGLRVLGPRSDGYHEIRTIFQSVALADRLEISLDRRGSGIRLECRNSPLPPDRRNLVFQAAEAWQRARGFPGGIRISLVKRIPIAAGLGGGSSDAAATLLALERLTGEELSFTERLELAAKMGSDVPFFLLGGRALGCGRGEKVWPLADLPPRRCLIVYPGIQISTAAAYRQLGSQLTPRKKGSKLTSCGARPHLPLDAWGPAENDFEPVVFARWPELARRKRQLIRAGAETACLSGSGSALFAVFSSAQRLARAARQIRVEVFPTRTLRRAEYRRLMFAR